MWRGCAYNVCDEVFVSWPLNCKPNLRRRGHAPTVKLRPRLLFTCIPLQIVQKRLRRFDHYSMSTESELIIDLCPHHRVRSVTKLGVSQIDCSPKIVRIHGGRHNTYFAWKWAPCGANKAPTLACSGCAIPPSMIGCSSNTKLSLQFSGVGMTTPTSYAPNVTNVACGRWKPITNSGEVARLSSRTTKYLTLT